MGVISIDMGMVPWVRMRPPWRWPCGQSLAGRLRRKGAAAGHPNRSKDSPLPAAAPAVAACGAASPPFAPSSSSCSAGLAVVAAVDAGAGLAAGGLGAAALAVASLAFLTDAALAA